MREVLVPLVILLLKNMVNMLVFWPKFVIYHLHLVKQTIITILSCTGRNWVKSSLYTGIFAINKFTDGGERVGYETS